MDHSPAWLSEAMNQAMWGRPRRTGHGGAFWPNVVHWRREWQTTAVFLPREPHAAPPAAKSLQSCPTLYGPIDGSLPGPPVPGILQARTLEWVTISFSNAWKWKVRENAFVVDCIFIPLWSEYTLWMLLLLLKLMNYVLQPGVCYIMQNLWILEIMWILLLV